MSIPGKGVQVGRPELTMNLRSMDMYGQLAAAGSHTRDRTEQEEETEIQYNTHIPSNTDCLYGSNLEP